MIGFIHRTGRSWRVTSKRLATGVALPVISSVDAPASHLIATTARWLWLTITKIMMALRHLSYAFAEVVICAMTHVTVGGRAIDASASSDGRRVS